MDIQDPEIQRKIEYCLSDDIKTLELSVRSFNGLKRHGVNTLEDLLALGEDDLEKVRNLNSKSKQEVRDWQEEIKAYCAEQNEESPGEQA